MGMKRSQQLSFLLADSSLITPVEGRLLQILHSRPYYYRDSLSEIAKRLQRSIRTVQRAIDSLLKKGLLIRQYSKFKKLILRIVSRPMQDEFARGNVLLMLVNKAFHMRKYKKKKDRRASHMTSMSHSTTESILNPKSKLDFEQIKEIEILRIKKHFGLSE